MPVFCHFLVSVCSPHFLWVCAFWCICAVCTRACVSSCTHRLIQRPEEDVRCPCLSRSTLFLTPGSRLSHPDSETWIALGLQVWGGQHPSLFVGTEDLNLGPQVCVAKALTTEPSLQFSLHILVVMRIEPSALCMLGKVLYLWAVSPALNSYLHLVH